MTILATNQDPVGADTIGWQAAMKDAIRAPQELARMLELPPEVSQTALEKCPGFELFAPRPLVSRMRTGDPRDPLLLQVWPSIAENDLSDPRFVSDPVGDQRATVRPGLIHKYEGRALLVVSGACGVHCRYCFRRHFPYQLTPPVPSAWRDSLAVIAQDRSIHEVILSGGDPLTVVDQHLAELLDEIESLPHVRRIRIHSRLPIVIPQRVTSALAERLDKSPRTIVLVLHVNHANEIDEPVRQAIARLRRGRVLVLNQAVLLRGINDSVEDQSDLSGALIDAGIIPYYLHQLDPVQGARHFEVELERGYGIVDQMRRRLPGYMVPRFVREEPGAPGKTILR